MDILDDGQRLRLIKTFAKLEVFERQRGDVFQCGRRGVRSEFEALKLGELRQIWGTCVGELGVVRESQGLETRELGDVRHPLVVEFGGDDVERLKRRDMAEVLEEDRVIGIVLAMVVRPRTRHGEINKFEALAVLGLFDVAFGGLDRAGDGFDVWVESQGRRREGEGSKEDQIWFHGAGLVSAPGRAVPPPAMKPTPTRQKHQ